MVFARSYGPLSSRLLTLGNGKECALVENGAGEIPPAINKPLNCRDKDDNGKGDDGVVHARAGNVTNRREKEEDSDHDCVGNSNLPDKLVKS